MILLESIKRKLILIVNCKFWYLDIHSYIEEEKNIDKQITNLKKYKWFYDW